MPKLIAVRLPEDIAEAIKENASKEDRTQSQIIIRALRESLKVPIPTATEAAAMERSSKPLHPYVIKELIEAAEPRYRKCQHGENEYTCSRNACKIKTGRL